MTEVRGTDLDIPAQHLTVVLRQGELTECKARLVDRWLIRADLATRQHRGEIGAVCNWTENMETGEVTWLEQRLRPPSRRLPKVMVGLALGMSFLVGTGVMLWESRYVLLATAVGIASLVAAIALLNSLAGGSRGSCEGVHIKH